MTCMAIASRRPYRRRRHYGEPLMPPLNATAMSLVRALIALAHEVVSRERLSVCQRRNAAVITRRVKLLLMLFEEVRDSGMVLPPSALLSFRELHVVIQGVKLLLDDCRESGRILLLMEHERFSRHFHELTQDMATALDILPLSVLEASSEVREQVELVRRQARKAKVYIDPKERELRAEVQSVMGAFERKETPDAEKLGKIFRSLELNSARECQKEAERLEEDAEGEWMEAARARARARAGVINGLVSFVRYCKFVLYGVEEMEQEEGGGAVAEMSLEQAEEEAEMKVPDDFRCPISLDVMRDPVIVATGQTYERAAITRWIGEGHATCPKSGLKLEHRVLIPNYALRSLIRHWCVAHNIQLLTAEAPRGAGAGGVTAGLPSTPAALEATKLTVQFLLRKLPAAAPELQRQIAAELRLLAKCGSQNRKVVADAGAIRLLLPLLASDDVRTKEHAVTALLNLSIYAPNKALIVAAGALDPLIGVLRESAASEAARENAAAALFSLSHVTEHAALLGQKPDALGGLLRLLSTGTPRGRRDAASALFNISLFRPNRPALVRAGCVPALLELVDPEPPGLMDEALAVLAVLSGSPDARAALLASPVALSSLAHLLRVASPKGKENSVAILLSLCKSGGAPAVRRLLDVYSVFPSLHSLLSTGTPRAQRKAASLLRILQKSEAAAAHVPQYSQLLL